MTTKAKACFSNLEVCLKLCLDQRFTVVHAALRREKSVTILACWKNHGGPAWVYCRTDFTVPPISDRMD